MKTEKEQIIEAVENLPEDATWEDAMYLMYMMSELKQSQEDWENGRYMTLEEAKERMMRQHASHYIEQSV